MIAMFFLFMPFATFKPSHSLYHIQLRVPAALGGRIARALRLVLKVSNNFSYPLEIGCEKLVFFEKTIDISYSFHYNN